MNLKTLRELKGISRKELAEQSGISVRSIQDYEQGHKDLGAAKAASVHRLAQVLDCSMEDLISEVDLSELKPPIDERVCTYQRAAAMSSTRCCCLAN